MSWLRVDDGAATDERLLAVAEFEDADERSVNEVAGFVLRLNAQAAKAKASYRVSLGTAMLIAPGRHEVLLGLAQRAGMLEVIVEDGRRVIELVEDAEFFHMRPRDLQDWENARKADTSNLALVIPIRLRDGDACRYCGAVVAWGDQKSARGATYDHLTPGQRAKSIDDMVVACRACNSGRRDAKESRDEAYPLKPALPDGAQYFSKSTIAWFEEQATVFTQLGLQVPKRRRGARDLRAGTQTRTDLDQSAQHAAPGPERAEHAAPASSGDQRSATASLTPPAHAAPHTSGEQRAGAASQATARDRGHGPQRPARTAERPAPATSASSEGTRTGHASAVPEGTASSAEVAPRRSEKRSMASANASDQSLLEAEADGSGFPGSGRVGTGRDGPGRGPRPQGGPVPPPGPDVRRRRRGRRRKG